MLREHATCKKIITRRAQDARDGSERALLAMLTRNVPVMEIASDAD